MNTVLRTAQKQDIAAMLDIYTPYVRSTVIIFETEPPAQDEFAQRFDTFSARYPWLVIAHGEDIPGYAYAHRFHDRAAYDWTAECTIYLRPNCRGQRLGRPLYTCLLETLRLQGCHTAVASICVPNARSEALHRALGFTTKGLLDHIGYKAEAWRDVAWYTLALADVSAPPKPLRPIGKIVDTPEFTQLLASCIHALPK